MDKKAKMEGGFAYQNTGKIENCYAAVKIGTQKSENAGFIYNNSGEALLCFTRSMVGGRKRGAENKKKKDGFTSVNSGTVSRCFFLVNKEKDLKQYRDATLGRTVEAAEPKQIGAELKLNYDVFEQKTRPKWTF